MGLLDGKVAIITGAGRGIGREHALLFAREGADVLINDLGGDGRGEGADATPAQEVAAECEALGARAAVNGANVADWKAAEEMVAQAVDTFGHLDILVNNAGILRDKMSFNMSEEDFDAVVNVVLKGCFAPSRHAAAYWKDLNKKTEQPVGGVIINTSSEAGLYGNAGQSNYGSAKAGIAALTVTMARELERIGVRVNAIGPGAATRLLATIPQRPGAPERPAQDPNAYSPLDPKHIAPLVAWLASDLASDVNGQMFGVSGMRIQVLQGWHPATQINSGGKDWTIAGINDAKGVLFKDRDSGIPPFMPPLEQ